jgi:cobalt-zinc-cadmium efflux system outer membrane protein
VVLSADTDLTIQQSYQAALLGHPDIQAQEQNLSALQSKIQAVSRFTPQTVSVESSYRTDQSHKDQGLQEMEVGLSMPLWHWNERQNTLAVREKDLQNAQRKIQQQKLELAGEVRRLFWDILAAKLDIDMANKRIQTAEQLLRDVSRRVHAGELPKTDIYQAQAFLAETQSNYHRAVDQFAELSTEFSSLTGLPSSGIIQIHLENSQIPDTLRPSDHPAILLAQSQVELETQNTALVKTQHRGNPELGLALISERSSFGSDVEKSWRISARIPLGNAPDYESRVLEAQSKQHQAELALRKAERSVITKGRAAIGRIVLFRQLKTHAQEQAGLSEKVYLLNQKSFALGETDLPSLLRLELQTFEAQRLARKTEVEYAAKCSLYQQTLGILPE